MNEHKRINKMLTDFALGELSEQQASQVQKHLNECSLCRSELKRIQSLLDFTEEISRISTEEQACESAKLKILETVENEKTKTTSPPQKRQENIWRNIMKNPLIKFAAAIIIISSFMACFVLSRKNVELRDELALARRDIATTAIDDSVTINLYLREHQEVIARNASLNTAVSQPIRMDINQDDIFYYEFLDDEPDFMRPGIIVRGPSSRRQISTPESPVISNGHTLTLFEAHQAADFDLVSPSWLRPCYKLESIRKIEGRDALQLLYTDGINSISLFEQPLDGQRGLEPHDFREYAVYRNQGQSGGTILAWRDDTLSYVLIGNIEISQLMNMAQSINAVK